MRGHGDGTPDGDDTTERNGTTGASDGSGAVVSDRPSRGGGPALWITLAGVLAVGLNLRPAITAIAPVLPDITRDLGLDSTVAGLLTTVPLVCFVVLSTSAPRFGARVGYARAIAIALAILAVGFVVRLLPGAAPLFVGTAVAGVAITLGNVLLPAYIKQRYLRSAGVLMAVYTASLYLGPAAAAAFTRPLSDASGSWARGLFAWIVPVFVAAIVWLPQLRGHSRRDAAGEHADHPRVRMWTDPLAWAVTLYFAVLSVLFYTVSAWLPTMLVDAGHDPDRAGQLLAVVNLVAIPFALVVSLLVARTRGQVWATTLGSVLLLVGVVAVAASPTSGILAWTVILGAGNGVATGIAFSLPLLRARHGAQTADLAAMSQTSGYTLSSLGPVGAGALHAVTGEWRVVLWVLAALLVVQLVAGLYAGRDVAVGDRLTRVEL